MKNLQLTPPLLIVTMGIPGSGKTSFTRQFSESHHLPLVNEEVLRYELFEDPRHNDDEADILQRMMNYSLTQLMQTESTIVCEGRLLQTSERKKLYELATKNGYRTLLVWLQTDVETAAARAKNRDRRNADSKYAFSLDRRTFDLIRNSLERPSEKEQAVVVSGKHAFKSQALTVLRKIASMYSESLMKGDFHAKNPLSEPVKPTVMRQPKPRFIQ